MGVSQSTDIAQEIMENTLSDFEEVEVYLDDIAVCSNDWESHVAAVSKVLQRLEEKGFTVNPLKFEWAGRPRDGLAGILAHTHRVEAVEKKVQAILDLAPPRNHSTSQSHRIAFFHRSILILS
jgi:hypothetical protein